jgi:hypothetical protein
MEVEGENRQLNDAVTRYMECESGKKFNELKSPKIGVDFAKHLCNNVLIPLLDVNYEVIQAVVPSFYAVAQIFMEAITKQVTPYAVSSSRILFAYFILSSLFPSSHS